MKLNYIDLIILIVLLYFALEALHHGFWILLADFISFLSSLLISFWLYKYLALILRNSFSISHSFSNALGFLISAIFIEALVGYILGRAIASIPEKYWKHKLNKILGIIPALGEGIILVSFFLVLTLALPIKSSIKNDIDDSRIGSYLVDRARGIEAAVNDVFGGVIEDSLTFLTVEPGNKQSIPLSADKLSLSTDAESETQMFALVNNERTSQGIPALTLSTKISKVARDYANYMWENHYFGHYSPTGKDVGNRLDTAGIRYSFAGENLALAPTLTSAFKGLLNSAGHRENILDKRFHKIGIGVVENGINGKLFVQVFTD